MYNICIHITKRGDLENSGYWSYQKKEYHHGTKRSMRRHTVSSDIVEASSFSLVFCLTPLSSSSPCCCLDTTKDVLFFLCINGFLGFIFSLIFFISPTQTSIAFAILVYPNMKL
uniref:Uncharacterized protein n=1 Tax=Noccaea caerulescens TaxID=107243 RepID=A0A1J3J758_NOCCA